MADWKSHLLNTKYNEPYLFGSLALSSQSIHAQDKAKSPVYITSGDVKRKFFPQASTSTGGHSWSSAFKKTSPDQPFGSAGG